MLHQLSIQHHDHAEQVQPPKQILSRAGAMVPFASQEDVDFFSHLELHLRQDHPPLGGRDHMAFRGSYYPVRQSQDTCGALMAESVCKMHICLRAAGRGLLKS